MPNDISRPEGKLTGHSRWALLKRICIWRDEGRAKSEFGLLLRLDRADVQQIPCPPFADLAGTFHSVCAQSALLQWQFEANCHHPSGSSPS